MKKLLAGTTAGLVVLAMAWTGGSGVARADLTSDRAALCGTSGTDACSIDIRDGDFFELTEGDSATLDVVGLPNVTSHVQMYTLTPSETPMAWERVRSYGSPVAFTTSAVGKASVKVPVIALTAPDDAGTLISFQLPGSTLESIQQHAIAPQEGGIPDTIHVRSARGKNINETSTLTDGLLVMNVAGGLPGDVYGVEMQISGTWHDISDGDEGNGTVGSDSYAIIRADVAGFANGTYNVRVFNRSRNIHDLELQLFQGGLELKLNVYITPGEHMSGGRKWRTTCEPYSATERCRTEIWSTEVEYRAGSLMKNTGWHFNNLTYKESPKTLWTGNPLGNAGEYMINGRQWRTECETFTTGRNGCRSYIVSDVVQATKKGNGYAYKVVRREVFNNIVLFEIPE